MILKSYLVEQNVEILKKYQSTLIYGENDGIKDDIKKTIKEKNKNSEIIIFFEEDVLKRNLLYENVFNQSLFSNKKIIFIQEASDKIIYKITECLEKENYNIQIYIFANLLDKKSKLRKLFEKNTKLAILPCYRDNDRTLINYINQDLKDYKGLTGEITNLIINNSNMDRKIIKNELIKIKDFFIGKKINKKEIFDILNIKNSNDFEEIRDKVLLGDIKSINKLLSETNILSEDAFFFLNMLNYRIMKLQEIIIISKKNNNNMDQVIQNLKPAIFWKDKPMIVQQLKKLNQKTLDQVLKEIGETELLMKKNSYLRNDVVIKDLIVKLSNKASFASSLSIN